MGMDEEAKARHLLDEADKKAKKTNGILGIFKAVGNSVGEACDLYVQAGNAFKVAKNWNASGNAFLKAAELHLAQGDAKHDAALRYADAANSFRKVDLQKAIDCYEKQTELYTDAGKFTMAAKGHTNIADLYEEKWSKGGDGGEKNPSDAEKAVAHHQKAADFYKGEESKSTASKSLIKVAMISAELANYKRAVEVFEEVAIYEADYPTLKYNSKTPFFQAILCHLCMDLLDAQMALKRYEELSPYFGESRECKFLKELFLCVEEKNVEQFREAIQDYCKSARLDAWYSAILARIERVCERAGADDDDEDIT